MLQDVVPAQVWQREGGIVTTGVRGRSEPKERDGDRVILADA